MEFSLLNLGACGERRGVSTDFTVNQIKRASLHIHESAREVVSSKQHAIHIRRCAAIVIEGGKVRIRQSHVIKREDVAIADSEM